MVDRFSPAMPASGASIASQPERAAGHRDYYRFRRCWNCSTVSPALTAEETEMPHRHSIPSCAKLITAEETEIPRSRSIVIQSERARRQSPRALTSRRQLDRRPNSSNFSVSVVLPASGCEMIA
jgi:hypothetical protein